MQHLISLDVVLDIEKVTCALGYDRVHQFKTLIRRNARLSKFRMQELFGDCGAYNLKYQYGIQSSLSDPILKSLNVTPILSFDWSPLRLIATGLIPIVQILIHTLP